MLAITTTDTLGIVDSALLKKIPSSIPSCLDLIATPVASSWTPDNISLFIASSRTIHKYDPSSNAIRAVYDVEGSESIRALISKKEEIIIFSLDHQINFLHFHGSEPPTVQTLVPHKAPVTSMSLSNDNSLLASASTGVVYVHNIASGSHTVLRGLGNAPGSTSVTFHTHFRTRLLVSLARQLLVYDTTRPSSPLKTIPLSDSSAGDIVALSCSPFSKTLVAVATSMGFIVMIDLEKEKAQLRTVNVKINPTALVFSPEGGAIYLGTDDGRLLVVDLRNLDKPAKLIIVSEIGDPIRTLSIQKKTKTNTDGLAKTPRSDVKTATKTPSEPLPPIRRTASSTTINGTTKSMSKTVASPVHRAGKTVIIPPPASRRLASATTEASAGSPLAVKIATSKKVLSPVKDPLGNTNDLPHNPGQVAQSRLKKTATTPVNVESKGSVKPPPSPSPRASVRSTGRSRPSSKSTLEPKQLRRSRTLPNSKSTVPPEEFKERTLLPIHSTSEHLCVPDGVRSRRVTPSRPGSDPCGSTSTTRLESSRNASRVAYNKGTLTTEPSCTVESSACDVSIRTSSPDLPDSLEPLTPAFKQQKNNKTTGMKVLGLGTPEVERWINAEKGENGKLGKTTKDENNGKGKSKTADFKEDVEGAEEVEELVERARKLSLQISPRRPVPSASGSTIDSWAGLAANSPALSAMSHPANTSLTSSPPAVTPTAHDLLKTIVQDVMFDFQRETKAEMMGLHLDLLRMGRSWKAELRSLMDEYVGDLREMRDENERLRIENERLRRGWQ